MTGLEVVVAGGIAAGSQRDAWGDLVASDPDATIFHTPDYLETWRARLGGRVEARIKYFLRDGALVGIVPEQLERLGTPTGAIRELRFLGGAEVTDYLGPIARPEDRDDVAAAWVATLADDREWDEAFAGGLAADTGWPALIAHHAEAAGLGVADDLEDVCPRIDLQGGHDAWLGALGGKRRHELRRKGRKLAREAGHIEVANPPVQEAIGRFLDLAASASGDKGRFFLDDRKRDFFAGLAERFGPDEVLRLHVLRVGDRDAAATLSFVHGAEWGLYNSAFDQELRAYGPGMVLIGELVRAAADGGATTFDLLRGDEPYKYRFGAVERPLRRLTLARG